MSPRLVLLVALRLSSCLALLAGCDPLVFDPSMDVLLAGDERTASNVARLDEYLDGRTLVAVAVEHADLFSPRGAADLRALSRALEALPGVQDVKSLTHSGRPILKGFSLDPTAMLDKQVFLPPGPIAADEWARLREFALTSPLARNLLVSPDGRYAQVLVVARRDLSTAAATAAFRAEIDAVVDAYGQGFTAVHVVAFPFLELEMAETVKVNLDAVVLGGSALILAILAVTFRSLGALVGLGSLLALGLASLVALFRISGTSVNLYTGMLFPLVAGLQLTFLVHLGTAWQAARRPGAGWRDGLGLALERVLRPSWIAAATTILGLLSLLVCDVGMVRTFGTLGAVAVAVVFALSFAPLWLLARRGTAPPAPPERVPAFAAALAALLARRARAIVVAAALVVLALVSGVRLVRTDVRASEYLPPDSVSARGLAIVDEHLGGMNVFELELDSGEPRGIQTLPVLEFMEGVRLYAERLPGVTAVYSYSQVLRLLNQLWHRDAPGSDRLPEQPMLLQSFALALEHSRYALLDSLLDDEARVARIILRTRDMPAVQYLDLLDQVSAFADEECPEGVELRARQGLHTLLEADRRLVRSQLASLGTCVLLVGLALIVLLGSLKRALCVLLVNLPPLAVVAGLLGYGGLPLNSVTVMVAAIVLGIAVDDSVHWLAYYARERERQTTVRWAVAATLAHKLRPLVCTTAVLCSALALFALAPFPPVADFGLLTAAALGVALLSVTTLLPALMLLTERPPERAEPPGSAG